MISAELKDAETFVSNFEWLTGEPLREATCDEFGTDDMMMDSLVFFGDKEDLVPPGVGLNLDFVSRLDRMVYEETKVDFVYNTEIECKMRHGIPSERKGLGMFMTSGAAPLFWMYPEELEPFDVDDISFFVTQSIQKDTPLWGKRAKNLID
jgi:hypothetical protein